ncbi:MAG TPA: EF-P lysine aminoacylase EpmA [Thermodesulfobacteriota bacterium]|nr:EF-P lysine aminoacylase EpmA [Thermodesulfobacteriota bacterium]
MVKNWSLIRRQNALRKRATILQAIRQFFINRSYIEVETPHRIPAPAPESYIDAIPSGDWFLQTSPELCMKRLVAAGYGKIFQICRCWREGERGNLHIPEFTILEWYRANSNYLELMDECEALIQSIALQIGSGEKIIFRGKEIYLSSPWERITLEKAFKRFSRVPMWEALEKNLFDEVMVQEIEPHLGVNKPTFIFDYPSERGALACLKKDDPTRAERFELYISGLELANAFSELIDPEEQRKRFYSEEAQRRSMQKRPYPIPEKFLTELEDMPPSAGIALGIDRLVMVFLDAKTIDEVVAFTPEDL